jgi:hypothetical protein
VIAARPTIKAADPRAWGACWSDAKIGRYFAGREEISVVDVLSDDLIEPPDRVWIGCAYLARHDRPALIPFANRCYAAAYDDAAAATTAYAAAAAAYAATATATATARKAQIAHLVELCAGRRRSSCASPATRRQRARGARC